MWSNKMNKLKKSVSLGIIAISVIGVSFSPAIAHHSFAAYNMNTVVAAEGTLKEFRWGAPHSSMVLTYMVKGKPMQMSIVSGSPMMFSKQGFNPRDFKRGDKLKITYHPNTSGLPGGALASLRLPSGKTFSDTEAARNGGV
jgi:hypothetical protein